MGGRQERDFDQWSFAHAFGWSVWAYVGAAFVLCLAALGAVTYVRRGAVDWGGAAFKLFQILAQQGKM